MSSLRAPCQKARTKTKTQNSTKTREHQDATDIQIKLF